jgi:hypothetical protein
MRVPEMPPPGDIGPRRALLPCNMASSTPKLWAYTYRFIPPLRPERLAALRALLARVHRAAKGRDGVWEGRMVADDRISHLLVLSDSADLDDDTNRRIAAALQALDAAFAVTVPLAVGDRHARARKTTVRPPSAAS